VGGGGNEEGRFREGRWGGMCAKGGILVNEFLFFEGVPFECEGKWNREGDNICIGSQ